MTSKEIREDQKQDMGLAEAVYDKDKPYLYDGINSCGECGADIHRGKCPWCDVWEEDDWDTWDQDY